MIRSCQWRRDSTVCMRDALILFSGRKTISTTALYLNLRFKFSKNYKIWPRKLLLLSKGCNSMTTSPFRTVQMLVKQLLLLFRSWFMQLILRLRIRSCSKHNIAIKITAKKRSRALRHRLTTISKCFKRLSGFPTRLILGLLRKLFVNIGVWLLTSLIFTMQMENPSQSRLKVGMLIKLRTLFGNVQRSNQNTKN